MDQELEGFKIDLEQEDGAYADGVVGALMKAMDKTLNGSQVDDPDRIGGRTPNMRMMRYSASYGWALLHSSKQGLAKYRPRLLEYFKIQRDVGMQTGDPTGGRWGYGCEQLTSSHHEQWAAGVYTALVMARRHGDTEVEEAASNWIAGQLWWWEQVDPLHTGRIICAGARAYAGKALACERTGRNWDWQLYIGQLPQVVRKKKLQAPVPTTILVVALKEGWQWPEPVECKLFSPMTVIVNDGVVETLVENPGWTIKTGHAYTRYDSQSGIVQFHPTKS